MQYKRKKKKSKMTFMKLLELQPVFNKRILIRTKDCYEPKISEIQILEKSIAGNNIKIKWEGGNISWKNTKHLDDKYVFVEVLNEKTHRANPLSGTVCPTCGLDINDMLINLLKENIEVIKFLHKSCDDNTKLLQEKLNKIKHHKELEEIVKKIIDDDPDLQTVGEIQYVLNYVLGNNV